jgi:hypothetical protein
MCLADAQVTDTTNVQKERKNCAELTSGTVIKLPTPRTNDNN